MAQEVPIPLQDPPPPGEYNCTLNPSMTFNSELDPAWMLDGQGHYRARVREVGGGDYIFNPRTSTFAFTSGYLKGWVGVWELRNNHRMLRFPRNKGGALASRSQLAHHSPQQNDCVYPQSQ